VKEFHPDLEDIFDELLPFGTENAWKVTPVLRDDDLRKMDMWSDETLLERY
jgi:hypothetical protein